MNKKIKIFLAAILGITYMFSNLNIRVMAANENGTQVETYSLGDGSTNLALNKAAQASSNEGTAGRAPSAGVDGKSDTRWASQVGKDGSGIDETWFQVDLGTKTEVNKVVISWESRPNKFKMQVSDDAQNWTDAGDVVDNGWFTAGGNRKTNIIEFDTVAARYVRMQGIQRRKEETNDNNTGYSLFEMEVYGPAWSDERFVDEFLTQLNMPSRLGRNYPLITTDDTYGVNIKWKSLNEAALTVKDGMALVHKTESEQNVVLEAQIERNNVAKTKRFNITIPSNIANEYNIYPIPQKVTYRDVALNVGDDINVVYEDEINAYTKAHLETVLTNNQYKFTVTDNIDATKTNILVGVYDGAGIVDDYFDDIDFNKANSVEKDEGYVLDVNNEANTIAVLGHENTGASYGLSTLDQMFEQSEGDFKEVTIEDYPETSFRGFIEGFYGNAWSYANRADLMEFCGKYKMNTYIYGPKNDPYHANQWRDPYPADKLAELKALVDKGKETNVEFVWAIHVGGKIDLGDAQDIQKVKDKFDQLYGIGVRQFAVFFDDSSTNNTQLVSFMNDLQKNYVEPKGDVKPLIFCPQYYNKLHAIQRNGEGYLRNLRNFDEDIQIMWTGDYVVSEINQSVIDYIVDLIDRPVYIWWNYPVNDLGRASLLHMGPTDALAPNISNMSGFVSNPMNQAQCNKVSLFSIANYTWNSTKYDSQVSWEDSWERIITDDEEALKAFAIFVQNCAGAPMSFAKTDESVYLQPYIEAFNKKYYAGLDYSEEAKVLVGKLEEIKDSINVLRNYTGTHNITSEMAQWLDVMYDIADAGSQTLTAMLNAEAISKNDNQSIEDMMNLVQNGRTLLAKSNNGHGGKQCAQKHLYPFVETLLDNEENRLYNVLSFEIPQKMFGSSASDYKNAMDGDNTTYVGLGGQAVNSYIGMDLGKITPVNDITIVFNEKSGSKGAYYKKAVLEYSTDKITWTSLGTFETPVVQLKNCDFDARFVRYRAEEIFEDPGTGFNESDVQLVEMSVNKSEEAKAYSNLTNNSIQIEKEKKEFSFTADQVLNKNDYIGIEFNQVKGITSLKNCPADLTAQYSIDKNNWIDVPNSDYFKIQAKYIRLINKNNSAYTFNGTLSISTGGKVDITDATITNASAYSGKPSDMYDNNESSAYWIKGGNNRDLLITLAAEVPLYDLYIANDAGRDCITSGTVYFSSDNTNWTEIKKITNGTAKNTILFDGQLTKYIKISIDDTGWLKINDIKVNTTVPENLSIVEGIGKVENITDGKLFTEYNTASDAGEVIYKTFNLEHENALRFLKSSHSIVKVDGLLNGEWKEIAECNDMYNEIYFEAKYEQFRFKWEADSNVKLYEVAAYYADADKTALSELYEKVSDLDSYYYTEATFKNFEKYLKEAKTILDKKYTTQDEVDQAFENLEMAYQALKYKAADYKALNEVLTKVKALDRTLYTEASLKALDKLVDQVNMNLDITKQAEVDRLTAQIQKAYNQLEKLNQTEPENPNKPLNPIKPNKPIKPNNPLQPNTPIKDTGTNAANESVAVVFTTIIVLASVSLFINRKKKENYKIGIDV